MIEGSLFMDKYNSNLKRKIFSIFLTVLMVAGCIAPFEFSAFAEDNAGTEVEEEAQEEIVVPKPTVTYTAGFQRVILKIKVKKAKVDGKQVYYEIRKGKGKSIVNMQKSKNSDRLKKAKDLKALKNKKKTTVYLPFDPYPGKLNGEAKYGKKAKSGYAKKATFAIRAYIKVKNPETGKTKKVYSDYVVKEDIEVVHPMYVIVKAKNNAPILKASDSSKVTGHAKSGHYYVVFGGSRIKGENKRVIIKKWNKKDQCWDARYIRSGNVDITRYVYNYGKGKDYRFTKTQIENFINDKKPSSKNNMFIWVNTYNQRVYLLKKNGKGRWEIYRNPVGVSCNTGKELSPYGSYRITGFMARKKTTGTKWWCLFNHVGVHEKLGDALGKPASGGCVRIPDSEAKWFYDNIRGGTGIFVY